MMLKKAIISAAASQSMKREVPRIVSTGAFREYEVPKVPSITYKDGKSFRFEAFYFPYAEQLLKTINDKGVAGLFEEVFLDTTDDDGTGNGTTFKSAYQPDTSDSSGPAVKMPLPVQEFSFDITKPGAIENWFLWFHLITLIVEHFLDNNRFDEAISWIENCLFNPKSTDTPGAKHPNANAPYWKLPVFKDTITESTTKFFQSLPDATLQQLIDELDKNPFNPFIIAYTQPQQCMRYVFTLYIRALILGGDYYFRQIYNGVGMDAMPVADGYYNMALNFLNRPVQTMPNLIKKKPESYQSLKDKGLRADSNVQVQYENIFPFCSQADITTGSATNGGLLGSGLAFYFAYPADKEKNALYELVQDRVMKLRNSQDIDGVARKIDLFGTPINPAQLLAALAKGFTLGEILGTIYAPAPIYRFQFLWQRALDVCNEAKSLGAAIVSSIEKADAENLALLRSTHEVNVLSRVTAIKQRQVYDALNQKHMLLAARETAISKLNYYTGLLGRDGKNGNPAVVVPSYIDVPGEIDEKAAPLPPTVIDSVPLLVDVRLVDSGESNLQIIPKEQQELLFMAGAALSHLGSGALESVSAFMNGIPSFSIQAEPFGVGGSTSFGGNNIGAIFSGQARILQTIADGLTFGSTLSAKYASYIRRVQELTFNANNTEREIVNIDYQLITADVKIQMAQKELDNHYKQIEEAKEVNKLLVSKPSSYANYLQITDRLKPIYKSLYDLAFYYARNAEQAYQYEKPEKLIDFVSYGFDNSISGCAAAADELHASLRKMGTAYENDCRRPLEQVISINLSRLDPIALLAFRKTGKATINLPEWFLLNINPAIYNAKWISLSFDLPLISGAYSSMSVVVKQEKNYIRITSGGVPDVAHFAQNGDDDKRFVPNHIPFDTMILGTGINDKGYNYDSAATAGEIYQHQCTFGFNSGFISTFDIHTNCVDKDYNFCETQLDSLPDIVIKGVLSVSLDEGNYKIAAQKYLTSLFGGLSKERLTLFMEIKRELSNEYYRFKSDPAATEFSFVVKQERFPYIADGKKITIVGVSIVTKDQMDTNSRKGTLNGTALTFARDADTRVTGYTIYNATVTGGSIAAVVPKNGLQFKIGLDKDLGEDSFVILSYTLKM